MPTIEFNSEDFSLLSNADILKRKKLIQDKIFNLLELTNQKLQFDLASEKILIEREGFNTSKISRGENYKELPYLVLDYPSKFRQKDIFACRTMFLWGSFFSATLHLQGKYLEENRIALRSLSQSLTGQSIYISCGDAPWQYTYDNDNYIPLSKESISRIEHDQFIKISLKVDLSDYKKLPEITSSFFIPFLKELRY